MPRSALVLALLLGCSPSQEGISDVPGELDDASAEAVFLDFEFDGELFSNERAHPQQLIRSQLMYTLGPLNGDRSGPRFDRLQVSNLRVQPWGGAMRITYRARLPVAWGKPEAVPSTYTFALPRSVSRTGYQDFTRRHSTTCVDEDAHDVDVGSMFYFFRPSAPRCRLEPGEIVAARATVTESVTGTTNRYPEYHKVWEDGVLEVVAIFGKNEKGAVDGSDAGIDGYNRFLESVLEELSIHPFATEPRDFPAYPGVSIPEVTIRAILPDGRRVVVVAMLLDHVAEAPPSFDDRYAQLSSTADLIIYNGHAGLGKNIQALASKGQWLPRQYVIVMMNGCATYAYLDSALQDAHADVNVDDPEGTKHMDLIANALPALFSSMPDATMALIRGLLSVERPLTYEQIFLSVDDSQVVLVTGEEDNEFEPR